MADGAQLRYGIIKGEDNCPKIPGPMGASEVVKSASGRFVTWDGAGFLDIADDGDALLAGWIEHNEETTNATNGVTIAQFLPASGALGVVFRIPVNAGTYVVGMRGKTTDIARTTNVQGAKLDASGEDNLIIVDGDLVNNAWVDVMINPSKLTGYIGVV